MTRAILILISTLVLCATAHAQVTIPGSAGATPPSATVATLGTCDDSLEGARRRVTDCAAEGDCSTGGGTTVEVVQCIDGAWTIDEGGGGGGGGDEVAVDGSATTNPDFRSEGDIDLVLCTGIGVPNGACPADQDVLGFIKTGTVGADEVATGSLPVGDMAFDPIEETELDSLSELNAQLGTSIADGPHTTSASALTTGLLAHEQGGLEADVSLYTGLVGISGGVTSEVDNEAELESHLAGLDLTTAAELSSAISGLEEEGEINATAITGNAADDQVLVGTGPNAMAFVSLVDCANGTESLDWNAATGTFVCQTITGGSASDSFKTWDIPGVTDPIADDSADTMTLNAGQDIAITGGDDPEQITIALDGDLTAGTTLGGAAIQTGPEDDQPESGEFGNAADLDADGGISDDVVDPATIAYITSLAGDVPLGANECFPYAEASAYGFICEGTVANSNEQKYVMPEIGDGVDIVRHLVGNVSAVSDVEGAGLATSGGSLGVDLTESGSLFANASIVLGSDGSIQIDTNGDASTVTTDVFVYRSGGENFMLMGVREFPTADGQFLRYNDTNNDIEWSDLPWQEPFYVSDSQDYDTNRDGAEAVYFDVAATVTALKCYCVGTSCAEDVDIFIGAAPNTTYADSATVCGTTDTVTASESGAQCGTDITNTAISAGQWVRLFVEDASPAAVPVSCTLAGTYD